MAPQTLDFPNFKGSVFRFDGTLTTLRTFTGSDGAYPEAGLAQATDGRLYGTTYVGGAFDSGTIFKIDTVGTLTTLHAFTGGVDGANPRAGVIQAADGDFYGTTTSGGAYGYGTIFRLDQVGTLTTLHSFTGVLDGQLPDGELIQAMDGNFCGTTSAGGSFGSGTVFELNQAGTLTTLYAFTGGNDGGNPFARLTQAADRSFYGTTAFSAAGGGTVFRLTIPLPSAPRQLRPVPATRRSPCSGSRLPALRRTA